MQGMHAAPLGGVLREDRLYTSPSADAAKLLQHARLGLQIAANMWEAE